MFDLIPLSIAWARGCFVDDIAPHLRRYSLQCLALLLALQPLWAALDAELKGALPHWLLLTVNGVLAAAGIIGGLLKQNLKPSAFGLPDPEARRHEG